MRQRLRRAWSCTNGIDLELDRSKPSLRQAAAVAGAGSARFQVGPRWRTAFGRWVRSETVPRVVEQLNASGLGVTRKAVYHWISGHALPRSDMSRAIISLSGGAVTLDDICDQRTRIAAIGGGTDGTREAENHH